MSDTSLSGLENVCEGVGGERRSSILSALTAQYLELEPRLSDRHIELYDNVFQLLVEGIELHARIELAERLAPLNRAPRETLHGLARDEAPEVAGPVLSRSPMLSDAELMDIVGKRGEKHRVAVARRSGLSSSVTDVLVAGREQAVLVALVENGSAKLSDTGAHELTEVARIDPVVAQALSERLQLPAQAVAKMLEAARAVVVQTLARAEIEASAGAIAGAVGRAAEVVAAVPPAGAGVLTEQQIVTLYVMKAFDEVEKALSRMASIPRDLVSEALTAGAVEPLMIVLKAAQFDRPNAEAMLSAKMSLPIGSRALREPMAQFDRVNAHEPGRMLKFVLMREQMRRAV